MRWVIVGSSGYIGSALCHYLERAGHEVVSVSRRVSGPAGCLHIQIENFSAEDFAGVFHSGDRVIYAAGVSSVSQCRKCPQQAKTLNSQLPVELLALAERAGADNFLYLSSVKARRATSGVVASECEGEPAVDSYGRSKWVAESLLLSGSHETRVNILRPAAVYGEQQGRLPLVGQAESVVHKRAFLWRRRLKFWGRIFPLVPATGYRSFVSIEDLLRAIVLIGESSCDGEIFIAAEPSFYDMRAISSAVTGRAIKHSVVLTRLALMIFDVLSHVGFKVDFYDVQKSELYSARHLKSVLKWRPRVRFSEYLRSD
ncbi:NAD(P)-dependent oxidoreductase [Microbulbifer bruguierae]|uniref:NAD(P)-dependent oxidoreductase n=1 Tax=Microbulbifer bruguierae TaxID=3029061 RepID=A0ABY8NDA5_9GAMM|nr:NAD(P)-dependent oxidoreductase [Microbulbifer bruguierae]WGL16783.1 NAD(P)-dependent oxidoreductase [Microbulbifer bruguierae]